MSVKNRFVCVHQMKVTRALKNSEWQRMYRAWN